MAAAAAAEGTAAAATAAAVVEGAAAARAAAAAVEGAARAAAAVASQLQAPPQAQAQALTLAQARARARARVPHQPHQGLAWAQARRRQHPWALERARLARAPRPRQHPWLSERVGAPPSRHCPPEPAVARPEPGAAHRPAACCGHRRVSQRRRMPRQRRGRAVAFCGPATASAVARRGGLSPGAQPATRAVSATCPHVAPLTRARAPAPLVSK
jgi:hypothetical protein